jgi:phosphate transport system substrate-binding protein
MAMSRGALVLVVAALAIEVAGLPVLAQAPAPEGQGEAIAIIVHRSNPMDNLSFAELRRIFLVERQTWPHGRKITVVLREPGQAERSQALALITGLTAAEFDKHVLFQTFRGNIGWGPRSIRSAEAMKKFVYNAPGAIGHVRLSEVDATIKVLRIDGLGPDEVGYRLRPGAGRAPAGAPR